VSNEAKPPPAPLALAELRRELLAIPASRRVRHLIELPKLRQVLRQLCPQDLLIAIHAAGVGDSLELIEALPPSQVLGIIDLECWRRDRIDPRALASWLSVLYAASAERALAQVMGLDAELVTLFIKLHTRVYDLGAEEEPEEYSDGALRTPDGRYLVNFVSPPNPQDPETPDPTDTMGTEVARKIISGLIAREPFTASRYLEAVRWELPSELEETGLRWRQGRLTDLGYFDLYEALAVYAPVDLANPPRARAVDVVPRSAGPDTGLALFVDEYGAAALLRAASERLEPEAAEQVRRQLVTLANRVAAAGSASPGDLESLAGAVAEATAFVNLGLEYLTRGDVAAAAAQLATHALIDVFRTGHTLAWQLGRKARAVRRRLLVEEERSLLAPPIEDLFAALTRRVPHLYAGLLDPGRVDEVPFESLAQLARAAEVVAETAFAAALLLDVLGFSPRRAPELLEDGTNLGDPAEVTLEVILATALCRAALGGALEPTALTSAELSQVQERCQSDEQSLHEQLAAQLVELTAARVPLPGAASEDEAAARADAIGGRLAKRLRDELGAVQEAVDPRFVTALLCRLD